MAIHAMIDLETLHTTPQATVLTVGGVKFNPANDSEPYDELYFKISVDDQDGYGRTTNDSTIAWWATQVPEARKEIFEEVGRRDLHDCLEELGKLIWQSDRIWANGICFDMNILEHAFKEHGINLPWKFWSVRDARTVYALWPDLPQPKSASHHALDDCKRQITMLQDCLKHLGITNLK